MGILGPRRFVCNLQRLANIFSIIPTYRHKLGKGDKAIIYARDDASLAGIRLDNHFRHQLQSQSHLRRYRRKNKSMYVTA